MSIRLSKIQPIEDLLKKEVVEFFLENPTLLFIQESPINIVSCEGQPFRYYAVDGNNRLFACYKLGLIVVPCVPRKSNVYLGKDDIELALEKYSKGFRTWRDLENRIVTTEEYCRIMDARFASNQI